MDWRRAPGSTPTALVTPFGTALQQVVCGVLIMVRVGALPEADGAHQ